MCKFIQNHNPSRNYKQIRVFKYDTYWFTDTAFLFAAKLLSRFDIL